MNIENVLREPVGEVIESPKGFRVIQGIGLELMPLGTKVYTVPPGAQAEIERMQKVAERLQKENELMREALREIQSLPDVDSDMACVIARKALAEEPKA